MTDRPVPIMRLRVELRLAQLSLDDLKAFFIVARLRSFRKAAKQLEVSPSSLSQTLRRLEANLGISLLNRTTRSVAATPAGETLLSSLAPAFDSIEMALDGVNDFRSSPSGRIRVSAPKPVVHLMLAPLIGRFLDSHPAIAIDIAAEDALVDIVESGFDAGIRFGESLHNDMIAVRLGAPQRMVLVGSPKYLERRGIPTCPADLASHDLIRHRFPSGAIFDWELEKNGEATTISPQGPLTVDDPYFKIRAAAQGAGLAFEFEGYASERLDTGELILVLSDWCPEIPAPYLYFPSGRNISAALRAFIDFIRDALSE